ncbi:MAG: hypothetical protein ABIV06_07585, partial [Thermoanaerobaculia bacterium]
MRHSPRLRNSLPLLAFLLAGPFYAGAASRAAGPAVTLDTIARDYVGLVLAIGEHDASYVDAYYGPGEWRTEVRAAKSDLKTIAERAAALIAKLEDLPAEPAGSSTDPLVALRRDYLLHQLRSAATRLEMLRGTKLSFDEESRRLYDAVAPAQGEAYF